MSTSKLPHFDLIVCRDDKELADRAADFMAHASQVAIDRRGRFTLALAGGTTPSATYGRLADPLRSLPIDWQSTFLFFSDERFVPLDDPASNYAMALHSLLGPAGVPDGNVFPIPTGLTSAAMAARAYEATLMNFFATHDFLNPPRFDLMLLGIGEDGHTASLFPGSPAMDVTDRWAVATSPGTLPPFVERVTMTLPVINSARGIVFLASGSRKAEIVRDVLESRPSRSERPVDRACPVDGQLTWMIDEAAAGLLTRVSSPDLSKGPGQ